MRTIHRAAWGGSLAALVLGAGLVTLGCQNTPTDFDRGPAPLRVPPPDKGCASDCYEDSLTGGQVFSMYCGSCHNARSLAERPFSNYRNVAAHMRVRADLTGKEYAKLTEFLRRWHDVPPPNPPPKPSPRRLTFAQPIQELRPKPPAEEEAPMPRKVEEKPPE